MANIVTVTFDPPQLSDTPAVFDSKAQASVNKFPEFIGQLADFQVFANGKATDAEDAADDAATAKTAAEDARDAAIAASTAVATDYNPGGIAYAKNNLVWDEPAKLYRCVLAYNSTATLPRADPAHWTRVNVTPEDIAAIVLAATNSLLDVPIVRKTAAHTLELSDRGKCISTNSQVTIPANSAVAFPDGTTIPIRNTTGSPINLLITTDTLRKNGTTQTGARSIPAHTTVNLHKDSSTVWYVSGAN